MRSTLEHLGDVLATAPPLEDKEGSKELRRLVQHEQLKRRERELERNSIKSAKPPQAIE
jgi:hypothetical protein